MITQDDLVKLTTIFATKEELRQMEDRITGTMRGMLNSALDKMDTFITEIRNYRFEQDAHSQLHNDLEERVDKIERLPVIASEIKKPKSDQSKP